VPFSGGLLLGNDFVKELYVHMGFHPTWKFREVHELIFKEGLLERATDLSKPAADFRKTIALESFQSADADRIEKWIEQTFSLRYK
jgi:hypothetical protein